MTKRQLLKHFYVEAAKLRKSLKIQGMPGQNLFDNGLGWDGELDHEMLVIADGLGAATLELLDQGCHTHSKRFTYENDALQTAMRLLDTAQGHDTSPDTSPLTIDDIHWDPA